jgi:hypothetical protein
MKNPPTIDSRAGANTRPRLERSQRAVNSKLLNIRSGKCEHVRDILIRLGVIKEDA